MTGIYITGLAALCIPQPGRTKPFWHSVQEPDSNWTVAGRSYPDTSWLFGERELVDVSDYFSSVGIKTDLILCASYERAVFDLLHHHIEQNNQVAPNVQPSDIRDSNQACQSTMPSVAMFSSSSGVE